MWPLGFYSRTLHWLECQPLSMLVILSISTLVTSLTAILHWPWKNPKWLLFRKRSWYFSFHVNRIGTKTTNPPLSARYMSLHLTFSFETFIWMKAPRTLDKTIFKLISLISALILIISLLLPSLFFQFSKVEIMQ